jgi:hypothetical protein
VIDQSTASGVDILNFPLAHCPDVVQDGYFIISKRIQHRLSFTTDVCGRGEPFTTKGGNSGDSLLLQGIDGLQAFLA